MNKVFINCGHCIGIDSGAVNTALNVTEAELVREIGELVKEKLLGRYEIMLEQSNNIKGEDYQDWYDSICFHANDWDADIVISLHLNASESKNISGTECWYISDNGKRLAQGIQDELVDFLEIYDRGIKFSTNYWILRYTDMPCCIVEIAFIDNVFDCLKVINNTDEIAECIVKGIDKYFL